MEHIEKKIQYPELSAQSRLQSFSYAFKGILSFFRSQINAWIQLTAAFAVIIMAIVIGIPWRDWGLLFLAIGMVLSAEVFNTAIEYFVDWVKPERSKQAANIKDLAAGAVLISAISALCIFFAVFYEPVKAILIQASL